MPSFSGVTTKGKVTGAGPGGYCIVSFPATWGEDAWKSFVRGGFDYACVWTGNDDEEESAWMTPWIENVKAAQEKGMKLLVFVHEDCHVAGGGQYALPSLLDGGQKKM